MSNMQKLPNETVSSLLSLTWLAIKRVFSKPKILILYLVITLPLCVLLLSVADYYSGWRHRNDAVLLWLIYLSFISLAYISYIFSLKFFEAEVNASKYISDLKLLSSNYKPIIFLKTLYFISVKNTFVFLFFVFYSWFGTMSQALGVIIFMFVPILYPIFHIILLSTLLAASYMSIKFMIAVPYGIIGGHGLYSACKESAKSTYGSKLSILCYFVILAVLIYFINVILMNFFIIPICGLYVPLMAIIYKFYRFFISYGLMDYNEAYYHSPGLSLNLIFIDDMLIGMDAILLSLIYSTTINLLYFKRTKVNQ